VFAVAMLQKICFNSEKFVIALFVTKTITNYCSLQKFAIVLFVTKQYQPSVLGQELMP